MYLFPYKVYKSDLKASGKLTTWAACGCASEQGEPKLVRGDASYFTSYHLEVSFCGSVRQSDRIFASCSLLG